MGAAKDDDGPSDAGAVWILFQIAEGTVKSNQKISATQGGFTWALSSSDAFGMSIANIDDLDGDTVMDIAVGAFQDGDGAVWILLLNTDGTVKTTRKSAKPRGILPAYWMEAIILEVRLPH